MLQLSRVILKSKFMLSLLLVIHRSVFGHKAGFVHPCDVATLRCCFNEGIY